MSDRIESRIEQHLEGIGFELVELERAGSRSRPILRLRIDRKNSDPSSGGVSLEDCARVSRSLEGDLELDSEIPDRYVLEVSSPGVERPLLRRRDFERYAGSEIAVLGKTALHGGARRVEGTLLGVEGVGVDERVLLRTVQGEEIAVPRSQTKKIHLVYRWGGGGQPG